MHKGFLYYSILTFVFFVFIILIISIPQPVFAYTNHLLISEIQLSGGTGKTNHEFIELYNPTDYVVVLASYSLSRMTKSGVLTEETILPSLPGTIRAHGYYLIAHEDYGNSVSADITYTGTALADNNTLSLYNNQTLVDRVGLGSATVSEDTPTINPAANKSVERKAKETSTHESMSSGGIDEVKGNGYDSDNNSQDFILRQTPDPQNKTSPAETLVSWSTPTPTPTHTPTQTPSPTYTPTPTATPTPLPTVPPSSSHNTDHP